MESLKSLKKANVIIATGGDIFSSDYSPVSMHRHFRYIELAKKLNKKVFLIGHSIGPFKTKEAEKYFLNTVKGIDGITVRESYSYEYLKKLNVDCKFELTSDTAFNLAKPKKDHILSLLKAYKIPRNKKLVGLALSQGISYYSTEDYERHYKALKGFVSWLIQNHEFHIVLIPHVVGNIGGDRILCNKLYRDLNFNENISVLSLDHSADELKGIISFLDILIGERTHATIASLSTLVPTIAIAYSVKAHGIFRDIFEGEYKNYVIDVKDLDTSNLIKKFEYAIDKKVPKNKINDQKKRALQNFSFLEENL